MKILDSYEELIEMIGIKSVWTIDIFFLLKNLKIDCITMTKELEINEEFDDHPFYSKEIKEDRKRISKLVRRIKEEELAFFKRSLDMREIINELKEGNCIFIILLNDMYSFCEKCDYKIEKFLKNCLLFCFPKIYQGHYVLLFDYDEKKNVFLIKDPSNKDSFCQIKEETLESARKSFGTEEDLIIINWKNDPNFRKKFENKKEEDCSIKIYN